jgi:hypothetical protein
MGINRVLLNYQARLVTWVGHIRMNFLPFVPKMFQKVSNFCIERCADFFFGETEVDTGLLVEF